MNARALSTFQELNQTFTGDPIYDQFLKKGDRTQLRDALLALATVKVSKQSSASASIEFSESTKLGKDYVELMENIQLASKMDEMSTKHITAIAELNRTISNSDFRGGKVPPAMASFLERVDFVERKAKSLKIDLQRLQPLLRKSADPLKKRQLDITQIYKDVLESLAHCIPLGPTNTQHSHLSVR